MTNFLTRYKDDLIQTLIHLVVFFILWSVLRILDNNRKHFYPNNLMLQKAVTLVEKDAIEDDGADTI